MNTKLLKQKILDLAIRGKLTQQLKSDGTAADLLKEISDAKSALSQPKGKKSKRFVPISRIYCENGVWFEQLENAKPKDISEEIPFEIPENWTWCRLECVCFDIADIDHKMPAVCDNGIPYISPLNFVVNNKIDFAGAKKISKEDFLQLSKKCKPERGDIIFPRYGTIGVIRTVETDIDFLVSYSCATIKPCKNHMDARYVSALLQSPLIQEIEIPRYINKTTQANVGLQSIKKFLFALPPLAEQQRIVEKIQDAFAEIDAIENNKELLKTHIKQTRQKILDLAIHGKLVPQNKSDEPASVLLERITRDNPHYEKLTDIPFEIPGSWAWVKLGDVCDDFIVPQRDKPTEFNGSIPWCRIEDIEGKYLNGSKSQQLVTKQLAEKMNMHLCPKGTVISACSASIGNQAITTVECYTNQTFIGIVCNCALFNEYLYYFLTSQNKTLKEMGKGTTIGYISRKKYEDFLLPLPPLAEQKRIVDKIEEIFASLDEISLHLV